MALPDNSPLASPQADFRGLRAAFPILGREVRDRPLVYLDTAATAQRPAAVIEAEATFQRRHNANVHRGLHTLSDEATQHYEATRARVAEWLGAARPEDVVITRGATSALNLVAFGSAHRLQAGDEVLLTEMEHHANLVPWLMLARQRGVLLRYLPVGPDGTLQLDALPDLLNARTKIVSLVHVSNVLGTVNPVAEIAAAAHAVGARVVVDAAQSVGHRPVLLDELGADLLAFSAHKAYGPMGLGFLVGRREALDELEPVEGGGEMIELVDYDRVTWAALPHRLEAGTPNVAAAAAFPPAIDLLETLGLDAVRRHEEQITGYALERLRELGGLRIFGPEDPTRRGGLVSFVDPLVHPHDLAQVLDEHGVAVRAGHHCAQPLHRKLGVGATARASFGVYSTTGDVDVLIEGLRAAREYFT